MTQLGRAFSDISEAEYLASYDIRSYPCYAVTADVALFSMLTRESDNYRKERSKALSVLLIHRRAHPVRVISNAFLSAVPERPFELHAGSDADDADWYEISLEPDGADTLCLTLTGSAETARAVLRPVSGADGSMHMQVTENDRLAFDHAAILGDAISLLRRRARIYELVFRFLPELFTLSDFQQAYEKLTGETDLTPHSRRETAALGRETGRFASGTGHRPARLYTKR